METGCSDVHSCWLTEESVRSVNPKLLQRFLKKNEDEDGEENDDEEEESESFKVERILSFKKPLAFKNKSFQTIADDLLDSSNAPTAPQFSNNNYKFLVKWEELDYSHCSWEDQFLVVKFPEKVRRFFDRKINPNYPHLSKPKPLKKDGKPKKLEKQPSYIEGTLYDYQLDGLSWLINCYNNGNNGILADEMGLGKTIQTLNFLKYLSVEAGVLGPFLIIVPTSTLYNWQKEAGRWLSNLDTIVYAGDRDARNNILKLEFVKENKPRGSRKAVPLRPKFHVAITSYSYINQDYPILKKIEWEVIIIDEAQRLKNSDSKLFKVCSEFDAKFRLLLTGTPIQNNFDELISLVKSIIPHKTKLIEKLEQLGSIIVSKGGDKTDKGDGKKDKENESDRENALKELKEILKHHMLRRSVQDVNIKFPDLEEKIVSLPLTNVQKTLYKNILVKNYKLLSTFEAVLGKQSNKTRKGNEGNTSKLSMNNILMSLRLVCDHPDLFYGRSDNLVTSDEEFDTSFLKNSNKLRFLDRVFPTLLAKGHKMLIFTQFVMMLDIVESYLIHKGYDYHRLDGTTKQNERQKIIDSFNSGASKIFILSTRAGGLGINLTSSDTIIFLDSDYNPYQDIQAFCRAYRIGQKNNVVVYRLVSKYTVEEKIVENAAKKLMLGELVVNPTEGATKLNSGTVESILRYGAKELFEKTVEEAQDEEDLSEEKIEELLNRESKSNQPSTLIKSKDLNDIYLSGFNLVDFNTNPLLEPNTIDDTKEKKYWESFLAPEYENYVKTMEQELGKGKRQRKYINMNLNNSQAQSVSSNSDGSGSSESDVDLNGMSDDSEFEINAHNSKEESGKEDDLSDDTEEDEKALPEPLLSIFNSFSEEFKKIQGKEIPDEPTAVKELGMDEGQRIKFLEFVLKFGMYFNKIENFFKR